MIKKYTLLFFILIGALNFGFGQPWAENFNSETSGTYGNGNININGRTWTRQAAGNFGYANTSMGSYAFTINDDNSGAHITTPVLNTCGTITFDYAFINGNSNNVFELQISTDGTYFSTLDTKILTAAANLSYVNYSIDINSPSTTTCVRILSDNQNAHLFIDNFSVTPYNGTSTQNITVSPSTISGLDYSFGNGPSTEQSFEVEGTLLIADIDITAPTNFEIATSPSGPYGNTVTIPALDANNTNTIYVRLAAGLPSNNYSGTITVSSTGATTENVSVNGEVTSSGSSCNELIISEYIEGSSNNKYIEIYNPTNSSINLANYRVAKYTNGSSTVSGTPPSLIGSIAPYSTYIIGNNNSGIYNLCDFINSYYDFNGNDVVSLQTLGGINIDVIGTIGNGSNFALDITLRRNSTIQEPNSTFSSSEWETHPQNTISDLGSHTSDCQGPTPELQLVDDTSTNQNCGYTIDFGSQALSTNTNITFDIENIGSADLDITSLGITGNYTVSPTGPMTISAGNSQTFTVTFTPTTNGTQNGTITINNNDSNEGTCSINLTGEGFTPAPEIDIERNTGGTIPNGSSPNIGYNTIFAATVMGDSSSPKTFHVSNEGTSDLDLTSITSSNPTEFSISLNPSPSTISSNTEVDFEIVFSPTGVGLRTSTITIISNDSDENPYTFQVQGNGDCAASPITISPMSGPEATIISISGNNFGSATTATLNGLSISSVNVISSTELELSVPSGATTGSLEITNDLGCLSSELFIVIDNQISSCEGNSGISPTELFISEVTDHGTGHHSYVEIFNGTGATVNLSGYEIRIHNNGASTATSSVTLSGSIINGDVFVLAFGQSDATDAHASHGFDQSSNVNGINEDDHIRLYNGTTWIDLWGDTSGDSFTIASKNYTYRRKNTGIIAPSTTWDSNDWDSFSPVDYTDIGTFDFSTGVPPSITSGPTINQSCNTATISVAADEGYSGGNSLTYQWYYLAPGNSGWTEIMDDATFNNSDTAILEILDIFPVVDYQFYCQVREDDQTCFKASIAVLLELESVTWDGSNWTPSNPTSNTIAVINGDYDTSTSGSFEACNLIINDSALIIGDVNNGGSNTYVEVQYSVYVNGGGSILVHPQAAFVQVNDEGVFEANNPDNCEVDKLTAPMAQWYEYTYWSSPTAETIGDALAEANPNRRFKFSGQDFRDSYEENSNTNTFNPNPGIDDIDDDPNYISDGTGVDWQLMNASDDMLPGVGYASTHSTIGFNSFPCSGGLGCQFLYQFKGLFNNGVISVPVYRNDEEPDDNNWNFIGNPYPSAISADAFLEYNTDISSASNRVIEGAIYLWSQNTDANGNASGNQALNFSQSDYAIINGIGSTATSAGGDGSNPDNRMIPSGQGFFITMSDGALGTTFTSDPSSDAGDIQSKDVIFNNSMRVKGNSDNSQFFRNATQETNSMESITLSLTSDNGIFSQVVVGYKDGATDGLDYMYYDAPANSVSNNMTLAYFQIEDSNKKFAIQGKHPESLTLEEVIPLGFQTNIEEASIFNFEIGQLKGDFMLSHSIYIKDNFFNTYHDLTQSAYTFNSEAGEYNDRFEIVFQTNVLSTSEQILDTNDLTIVELQNGMVSFTVGKNKTIDKVQIYDLLGRSLLTFKGNSSKEVLDLSSLSSSAYLAKITLNNGQEITKKAIKR
ncbi:choice-of-anchor D domain-containing protein [Mangrovimonas sp. AS39]|uniref:choice-of-anchor D domain-containing protein n=1 Tax=Mangrovimonas futianensis TaxID=2895523 RepID=UPI001E644CD2|nr:choice-of-anchor D domain-containing protein [Mangrovimonas futianensis]MCF1190513.1 choice-of-anchor D domain-containing protein [Mangrovimonas futianensis]MCF1193735.1 choice-of-anchor D domain-containing protein [Mangrovimonas futianensis]